MKALLYKENGKLQEISVENIDTITGDSDGLCIQLSYGKGDIFCKLLTIEDAEVANKKRALAFLEENTKYRYIKSKGLDPDKEYYIKPNVAREAIEIALGERIKEK